MVCWLIAQIHKTSVVSSNHTRITIKSTIGDKGNGKPPHAVNSLEKTQSPFYGVCYARNRVCNAVAQNFGDLFGKLHSFIKCYKGCKYKSH